MWYHREFEVLVHIKESGAFCGNDKGTRKKYGKVPVLGWQVSPRESKEGLQEVK